MQDLIESKEGQSENDQKQKSNLGKAIKNPPIKLNEKKIRNNSKKEKKIRNQKLDEKIENEINQIEEKLNQKMNEENNSNNKINEENISNDKNVDNNSLKMRLDQSISLFLFYYEIN